MQTTCRQREQWARTAAVRFTCRSGLSRSKAAMQLGISPRTLRHWRQRAGRNDRLRPRGRPPKTCDVASRNRVIRFLHQVTGPCVSIAALRRLFPAVPTCVLNDLLVRYRRVWRLRYARHGYRLAWHAPGRVWAIDHSEASCPIDGVFNYVVAVRDLASNRQLAWTPCSNTGAKQAAAVIKDLFSRHGPPLVLKSDNGSAFISELFSQLIQQNKVAPLFNPPRRPQYNGSLERSNGTLKVYTALHAMRDGHPFRWTSDDLEAARTLANTITRPWGHLGPTPAEAWSARDPITDQEREAFQQALEAHRMTAHEDLGLTLDQQLNRTQQAQLDRLAITRTAEQLGYLTIKRRHRSERPRKVNTRRALELAAQWDFNQDRQRAGFGGKRSGGDEKVKQKKLASGALRVTMPADVFIQSVHPKNSDVTPTAKTGAFTSWKRRLITLLLSLLKAANIKH